jgi:hypothetical protein
MRSSVGANRRSSTPSGASPSSRPTPDEMEEFDLPAAYEALARAHAAAGNSAEARRHLELGRAQTAKISDAEDREHMESQLASIVT